VVITLPSRPEVTQQHGYFHAGATGAIADSAGGYAAFTLFPEDTSVLTVEYKINLLAPAVGDRIEAVGTVLKPGRTSTVCQLEVFAVQDGQRKLVAAGQQTLICLPPARGVLGVVEFDGGGDVGAQGGGGGGTSKAARSRSRGVRSVRSNTPDRTEGSNRRRYSATISSLPVKRW
jgi:uncharacterized protein (TIGR00369 family)